MIEIEGSKITPASPFIISEPGDYRVVGGISGRFETGAAIWIQSDDVRLDAAWQGIFNERPDSDTKARAVYCNSFRTNVHVRNVHSCGFLDIVTMIGAELLIEGVTGRAWQNLVIIEGDSATIRHVTGTAGGTTYVPGATRGFGIQNDCVRAVSEDNVLIDCIGGNADGQFGEGVGISHGGGGATGAIRRNYIINRIKAPCSFGTWVSGLANRVEFHDNTIVGYDVGFAAAMDSAVVARNNVLHNVNTPFLGPITDDGTNKMI